MHGAGMKGPKVAKMNLSVEVLGHPGHIQEKVSTKASEHQTYAQIFILILFTYLCFSSYYQKTKSFFVNLIIYWAHLFKLD